MALGVRGGARQGTEKEYCACFFEVLSGSRATLFQGVSAQRIAMANPMCVRWLNHVLLEVYGAARLGPSGRDSNGFAGVRYCASDNYCQ
jgi:hypothetical protein